MSSSLKNTATVLVSRTLRLCLHYPFLPKVPTVATTDSILSLCYDEHCYVKKKELKAVLSKSLCPSQPNKKNNLITSPKKTQPTQKPNKQKNRLQNSTQHHKTVS